MGRLFQMKGGNMLLRIALRNVFRHKTRTLISVFTISVGIMVYIAFDSLFNGIDRTLIESIVKFSDSSIVIYSKDYDENRKGFPLDKGIKDVREVERVIRGVKDIEGFVYRTQFLGEVIFGGKSKYIVCTVIDPELDLKIFEIKDHIKGRYLQGDLEILIGSILAKKLGVSVGDWVTLAARTAEGGYNALDFVIVGIIESPNALLNESGVMISYSSANKLVNLKGMFTSVNVKVRWNKTESVPLYLNKIDMVASKIRENLENYSVYTVKDLYGDFLLLMDQKRVTSYLLTFLILIIAGVGIANNILMAVYERIKEIGVLMAMGMKEKDIRKLFLIEGATIGILGGILGVFLGLLLDLFFIYIGYDVTSMFGDIDPSELGMPVWTTFYGEWNFMAFLIGFVFSLFISIIFAYIPSRYASKLKVVECLKFV
ncbi:MAG: ABC transporter permease [Brevinematia bacterium]